MTARPWTAAALTLTALLALAGCGGGGQNLSAGIGGTGKTASGSITGFGSIFVNGVEYDTRQAQITVDDEGGKTQSDLRLGMVVKVAGTVTSLTGVANSVVFDADVEGPVTVGDPALFPSLDGNTKTFEVLGLTVIVDATGTVFDDADPTFAFANLAASDLVEVSGFLDAGSGLLRAAWIKRYGTLTANPMPDVELRGSVTNADPNGFDLGPIHVTVSPSTDLSAIPGGAVVDGMYVEARGLLIDPSTIDTSGGAVLPKNRTIGEDGDDGDDISLEGIVSDYTGIDSFEVAGQPVNGSGATLEPSNLQLADGLKIEVEGTLQGGVLVADRIESRADNVEVHALVMTRSVSNTALNEGTIRVTAGDGSITAMTDSRTSFLDRTGADSTPPLHLGELGSGDFVEMRGFLDNSGRFVASEVRRDTPDNVLVQAPAQDFSPTTSLTLLGVVFTTGAGTEFARADDTDYATAAEFYNDLSIGDLVKVDDANGDGTADEVEFEE